MTIENNQEQEKQDINALYKSVFGPNAGGKYKKSEEQQLTKYLTGILEVKATLNEQTWKKMIAGYVNIASGLKASDTLCGVEALYLLLCFDTQEKANLRTALLETYGGAASRKIDSMLDSISSMLKQIKCNLLLNNIATGDECSTDVLHMLHACHQSVLLLKDQNKSQGSSVSKIEMHFKQVDLTERYEPLAWAAGLQISIYMVAAVPLIACSIVALAGEISFAVPVAMALAAVAIGWVVAVAAYFITKAVINYNTVDMQSCMSHASNVKNTAVGLEKGASATAWGSFFQASEEEDKETNTGNDATDNRIRDGIDDGLVYYANT